MNSLKKSEECFHSLREQFLLTEVPKPEADQII